MGYIQLCQTTRKSLKRRTSIRHQLDANTHPWVDRAQRPHYQYANTCCNCQIAHNHGNQQTHEHPPTLRAAAFAAAFA